MEILGFEETPERKFRDQTFNKLEDPGFLHLLDGNKFLGTGDNYLRSDQIVKVRFFNLSTGIQLKNTQLGTSGNPSWPKFHPGLEKSLPFKNKPLWFPQYPTSTSCFHSNSCRLVKLTPSCIPDKFLDIFHSPW